MGADQGGGYPAAVGIDTGPSGPGQNGPRAEGEGQREEALRPLAANEQDNSDYVEWVDVKIARPGEERIAGQEYIEFNAGDIKQGMFTSGQTVRYRGKTWYAKWASSEYDERKFIVPQAEILSCWLISLEYVKRAIFYIAKRKT